MNLREALDHYHRYAPDLSPRTTMRNVHDVNRFNGCFGNDPDIVDVTTETFAEFRRWGLAKPLSPNTIENTIGTVLTVLNHALRFKLLPALPDKGRTLRRPQPKHEQPTLEEFQKFYACVHVAKWPRRLHVTPSVFWSAFSVTAYFTALRLSDLLTLEWAMVNEEEETLVVTAQKTDKRHTLPLHPVLFAHLKMMHGPFDRIFPVGTSMKQLRREMQRISKAAGVPYIGPQKMRRLSATEWERARHGAGQLVQGGGMRNSSRFYIAVPELLREAMDKLRIPEAVEIAERIAEQQRLERIALKEHQFEIPRPPDFSEWGFAPGCACFRGRWFKITGSEWRALKCLVEAGRPIGAEELAPAIYEKEPPAKPEAVSGRIGIVLSRLRGVLRGAFGLDDSYDPVPCVTVHRKAGGGQWTVYLPMARKEAG